MPDTHEFVYVTVKDTGERQLVPAHWLSNPHIPKNFEVSAESQTTETAKSQTPSEEWTVKELEAYADTQGIDLAGATKKADILAAITTEES